MWTGGPYILSNTVSLHNPNSVHFHSQNHPNLASSHCAYGTHSLGARLCVEHFTCTDACKPHSSQWLLLLSFIDEETEA